jgi:flagellar basal body rod protein FlgG
MIKGFYSAASAMVTNMQRQMVLTQQILTSMDEFKTATVSRQNQFQSSPELPAALTSLGFNKVSRVGDLGLGVMSGDENSDFTEGAVQVSTRDLDVAALGNGFFRIQTSAGERYTKDGRFIKDATGVLKTIDGNNVLADGGGPITLPNGQISIATDGQISVDGVNVAKLGVAYFEKPETSLTRDGENTFTGTGAQTNSSKVTVRQYALESSNADLTQVMTQMIQTNRAYEAAQRLVQNQDSLLGQSISTLGKF